MTRTVRSAAVATLAALAAIVAIACADSDPADKFTAVAAGYDHTCAIRESGAITCWGAVGDSYHEALITPPDGRFTAISARDTDTCAIRESGAITCWGANYSDEDNLDFVFAPYTRSDTFRAVRAFHDANICAIRASDGAIECWYAYEGVNWRSTAADGEFIALGGACDLRSDGAIECWADLYAEEGWSTVPVQRDQPTGTFRAVNTNENVGCAIRANDNAIECWGDDSRIFGVSRSAIVGTQNRPHLIPPPAGNFTAVSVGVVHACAIREDRTIECWGSNRSRDRWSGEWGTEEDGLIDAPAGNFIAVSVGQNHACAISEDRTIACWGNNERGQSTPPPDGEFVAAAPNQPQAEQATDHDDATAQMTIDEYARWCNEARYGAVTPDTTWAEAADLLTETIAEFERVAERLPTEQGLAEYHEVMIDALRVMQSAAQLDDIAGSVADLFNRDLLNLFNIPEMLELAVRVGIALEGLTPVTRTKLGNGCI